MEASRLPAVVNDLRADNAKDRVGNNKCRRMGKGNRQLVKSEHLVPDRRRSALLSARAMTRNPHRPLRQGLPFYPKPASGLFLCPTLAVRSRLNRVEEECQSINIILLPIPTIIPT